MSESEEKQESPKCKCCKCKAGKLIGGIAIAVVVLLIIAYIFIGSIIKSSIQTVGSTLTKTNITVANVDFSAINGHLLINDLVVGNTEDYKTDCAIKLAKVEIKLQPMSLLSEKIIINDIQIIGPELTYEVAPLKMESNLGAILKNVQSFLPQKGEDDKEVEEKKEKSEKPGKKMRIDHVIVADGKIGLSTTLAGGAQANIPLPKVELSDLGKEKDLSAVEAVAQVMSSTLTGAVSSAGDAVKNIGAGAGEAVKEAGKKIGNILGIGKDKAQEK